jgi:hypothetical protein
VRQFARLLSVALLLALPATSASAHKLKVFAFAEDEIIRGLVYFSGNGPAQGTRIQVFDPDGALLAEATTDSEGTLRSPPHAGSIIASAPTPETGITPSTSCAPTNFRPRSQPSSGRPPRNWRR